MFQKWHTWKVVERKRSTKDVQVLHYRAFVILCTLNGLCWRAVLQFYMYHSLITLCVCQSFAILRKKKEDTPHINALYCFGFTSFHSKSGRWSCQWCLFKNISGSPWKNKLNLHFYSVKLEINSHTSTREGIMHRRCLREAW